MGRTQLTVYLVRVTLAVPMRVDQALRIREERAWREEMERRKRAGQICLYEYYRKEEERGLGKREREKKTDSAYVPL